MLPKTAAATARKTSWHRRLPLMKLQHLTTGQRRVPYSLCMQAGICRTIVLGTFHTERVRLQHVGPADFVTVCTW